MAFKEVASLDADKVVSIGKTDRKTGKVGPKSAEGYYLGTRVTQNTRGESKLHFLKTSAGPLGIWGTTDMNRKLASVKPGTMVRITAAGTRPTPNGDMYLYKVETDATNTIEVELAESAPADTDESDAGYSSGDESEETTGYGSEDESDDSAVAQSTLAAAAERKAKVEALLRGKGKSTKN